MAEVRPQSVMSALRSQRSNLTDENMMLLARVFDLEARNIELEAALKDVSAKTEEGQINAQPPHQLSPHVEEALGAEDD